MQAAHMDAQAAEHVCGVKWPSACKVHALATAEATLLTPSVSTHSWSVSLTPEAPAGSLVPPALGLPGHLQLLPLVA